MKFVFSSRWVWLLWAILWLSFRLTSSFCKARIKWMMSLGEEIGGLNKAKAMINAEGVSLILKSIQVQFRRPVTYPDSVSLLQNFKYFWHWLWPKLVIGYRPLLGADHDHQDTATTFHVTASAYSLAQKAFVAHSKETLVWYDYDKQKKCDPGEKVKDVLWGRVMTKG